MKEGTLNSTETWIFPNEPVRKGSRPVFPETPIEVVNVTYLAQSRLRARRRRHQRGFELTARHSTSRQH